LSCAYYAVSSHGPRIWHENIVDLFIVIREYFKLVRLCVSILIQRLAAPYSGPGSGG
jgi:hypothetical protein